MAERDKSQGIAFVYAPVKELIRMQDPDVVGVSGAMKVQINHDQLESLVDHVTNLKRMHAELTELAKQLKHIRKA